eukprot:TRINITY_DN27795_c0_g1_i1.p1 TRINITY_DN27795_c0_g1~~TRINITY_DN27795_c0_g1_i1.p1  ORF type:complete len:450 (-),score=62.25 TRINITY_DN27795_c0_g1_i1:19-1236(-)
MRAAAQVSQLHVQIVAAYEVSELCKQAYCHNYGGEEWKVKTIERLQLQELQALDADVWLMSPPCQPFTRSGRRKDHEDDRSRALLHLIEMLKQMRNPPRRILLENVIGFERSECRRKLLEVLAARDWEVAEFALDPEDFGLPNRRPRYYGLFRPKPASSACGSVCWVHAADALLVEEPQLQGWSGPCAVVPPLGEFLQDSDALQQEEKRLGCLLEVDQEVMLTRLRKDKRYDIHLRADRTSACLTKANGKLPYGHSPLVVLDESLMAPLEQRPKLSLQGQGPGAATDHVWQEGVRVRYLSPSEQLRLMGYPESYSLPPSLGFKDCCSLIGNSLNVCVVASLLPILILTDEKLEELTARGAQTPKQLLDAKSGMGRSAQELVSKAWGPRERWSGTGTSATAGYLNE